MSKINPLVGIEFTERERAALDAARAVLAESEAFVSGMRQLLGVEGVGALETDLSQGRQAIERLIQERRYAAVG